MSFTIGERNLSCFEETSIDWQTAYQKTLSKILMQNDNLVQTK